MDIFLISARNAALATIVSLSSTSFSFSANAMSKPIPYVPSTSVQSAQCITPQRFQQVIAATAKAPPLTAYYTPLKPELLTLIYGSSAPNADQAGCPDIDLSDSLAAVSGGNLEADQGSLAICSAYSAANALSFEAHQPLSSLSFAIARSGYLIRMADNPDPTKIPSEARWWNIHASLAMGHTITSPSERMFSTDLIGTGDSYSDVAAVINSGAHICLESALKSQDKIGGQPWAAEKVVDVVRQIESFWRAVHASNLASLCGNFDSIGTLFKQYANVDARTLEQLITWAQQTPSPGEFIGLLNQVSCGSPLQGMKPMQARLMDHFDLGFIVESINHNHPVMFSLPKEFLARLGPDSGTGHAVLVVGTRPNHGQCEILLHNSWGMNGSCLDPYHINILKHFDPDADHCRDNSSWVPAFDFANFQKTGALQMLRLEETPAAPLNR